MTAGASGGNGRPLVIAIGNRYRRDDGVAASVLDSLAASVDPPVADLLELDGEPARVVEAWTRRRSVVVIDAIADPGRQSGEVVVLDSGELALAAVPKAVVSGHAAGLSEAIGLGKALGRMPVELTLVGIVGSEFGEGPGLSAAAGSAVDAAVAAVREVLAGSPAESEVSDVPR